MLLPSLGWWKLSPPPPPPVPISMDSEPRDVPPRRNQGYNHNHTSRPTTRGLVSIIRSPDKCYKAHLVSAALQQHNPSITLKMIFGRCDPHQFIFPDLVGVIKVLWSGCDSVLLIGSSLGSPGGRSRIPVRWWFRGHQETY